MSYLKRFLNFYINSSIHVSFAVVALAVITYNDLDIIEDVALLLFLFFGSVSGYNFVKYAEVAGLHHRSLTKSLREIQIFSFVCGVGLLLSLFWLSREALLVTFFLGVLTLFYAVPFFSRKRNLRAIAGIKIYVIAIVWAGATVLLPVEQSSYNINTIVWVVFIQRVIFIIVLMIPFEIRDLQYDDKSLKTLPQLLGVNRVKKLGYFLLCSFYSMIFLRIDTTIDVFIVQAFITLLLGVCIYMSNKIKKRYFTSFWVESIPIIWVCITLLYNAIFEH